MAVYWVDPYIDTTKGGIHGTTSTTTRDGAYATPFGLAEMFDANAITALNGTSLASGDEIRLKGQALTDFYYNIGTTGNTVDITSVSTDSLDYASTDEQYVTSYRTALAATSETTPAIIIHDPGMLGTNKFMLTQGRNTFPSYTNAVRVYPAIANAIYGWLRAKTGIDVNDNVKVAFVDPVYTFDYNAVFSGSNPDNAFNFGLSNITVTDGWLSSSTRGGFTILPIKAGGSHNMNCDWWSNSTYISTFDMPSTFINWYHPNFTHINSLKHRQYFYRMTEGAFHLGQFGHSTTSAWNYMSINAGTANTNANENPCVEFGNFLCPVYSLWNGTGPSVFADRPVIRISNLLMGKGPYPPMSNMKLEIGNFIIHQAYTQFAMFYNNSAQGKLSFLDNAHIFGHLNSSSVLTNAYNDGFVIPASATNYLANNLHYPGAAGSSGGPKYGKTATPSEYMVDNVTEDRIPIAPTFWGGASALNMHGSQTVLSTYKYGQWNNNFGILACGSTDYKTTNANILLVNQGYTNDQRFAGQNMHFVGNTFDGAPLALWGQKTTATNTAYSALLSYNNAAGDIVVMMSSNAEENKNHIKSFVFQLPDLSTATSLAVSYTIEKSSSSVVNPTSRAFFVKNNLLGLSSAVNFGATISGNVYTMTATATNLDPDARFMGINIVLGSGNGLSVTDTYTISAPTFTVT
jgi:hypothetical protein